MPTQQTDLTSETGRDVAGPGFDLSITLVKDAMGDASAAARADRSIAAPGDALAEKDAAGPMAAPRWSVLNLLRRYWSVFQEGRDRERLRTSLHELSERELMDIGIAPGEIEYIVAHRAIDRLRDGATYLWSMRGDRADGN
jgi:uncharacterized protein YjiS (DUF1127 family)